MRSNYSRFSIYVRCRVKLCVILYLFIYIVACSGNPRLFLCSPSHPFTHRRPYILPSPTCLCMQVALLSLASGSLPAVWTLDGSSVRTASQDDGPGTPAHYQLEIPPARLELVNMSCAVPDAAGADQLHEPSPAPGPPCGHDGSCSRRVPLLRTSCRRYDITVVLVDVTGGPVGPSYAGTPVLLSSDLPSQQADGSRGTLSLASSTSLVQQGGVVVWRSAALDAQPGRYNLSVTVAEAVNRGVLQQVRLNLNVH